MNQSPLGGGGSACHYTYNSERMDMPHLPEAKWSTSSTRSFFSSGGQLEPLSLECLTRQGSARIVCKNALTWLRAQHLEFQLLTFSKHSQLSGDGAFLLPQAHRVAISDIHTDQCLLHPAPRLNRRPTRPTLNSLLAHRPLGIVGHGQA